MAMLNNQRVYIYIYVHVKGRLNPQTHREPAGIFEFVKGVYAAQCIHHQHEEPCGSRQFIITYLWTFIVDPHLL